MTNCIVCDSKLSNKRWRRGHSTCSDKCFKSLRRMRTSAYRHKYRIGGCGSRACSNGFPHTFGDVACNLKKEWQ